MGKRKFKGEYLQLQQCADGSKCPEKNNCKNQKYFEKRPAVGVREFADVNQEGERPAKLSRSTRFQKVEKKHEAGFMHGVTTDFETSLNIEKHFFITELWLWPLFQIFMMDLKNKKMMRGAKSGAIQSFAPKDSYPPGVFAQLRGHPATVAKAAEIVRHFKIGFAKKIKLRRPFFDDDELDFLLGGNHLVQITRGLSCTFNISQNDQASKTLLAATIGNLSVYVVMGDILESGVNAILNPASKHLSNRAGAARSICNAAGVQYSQQCRDALLHLPKRKVAGGTAIMTSSGSLKGQTSGVLTHVVHAVGAHASSATSKIKMDSAVKAALSCIDDAELESLAIPLMGAGLNNWDVNVAANSIVAAIVDWEAERKKGALNRIVLIDLSIVAVNAFVKSIRDAAGDGSRAESTDGPITTSKHPQQQWSWQNHTGDFVPFDSKQNATLERAYYFYSKNLGLSVVKIVGDFEVLFDKMVRKNIKSKSEHKVIRTEETGLKALKFVNNFFPKIRSVSIVRESGPEKKLDIFGMCNEHIDSVEVALKQKCATEMYFTSRPIICHDFMVPRDMLLQAATKRANVLQVQLIQNDSDIYLRVRAKGKKNCSDAILSVAESIQDASTNERLKLASDLIMRQGIQVKSITENAFSRPGCPLYEKFLTAWRSSKTKNVRLVFHGTSESNVNSILVKSLDPCLRCGQSWGIGEYFGLNFKTSLEYCKGGRKMLVFAILHDPCGITTEISDIVVVHRSDFQLPMFTVDF